MTEPRSNEHLREPEYSQPLVTALQLCIIAILESWNIVPQAVVGHSSGEIAAAYSAGFLSRPAAIIAAYYRGRAATNCKENVPRDVGMLAVGLSADGLHPFLEKFKEDAWIACFNSPNSLTVSGRRPALETLKDGIQSAGHFARLLQVDLAYHSRLMEVIGQEYENLLDNSFTTTGDASKVAMFSSVSGIRRTSATDASYWRANMISPVRFNDAMVDMLSRDGSPNFLVEIGPSGALGGPISQIMKALPSQGKDISYCPSWSRGAEAFKAIFDVAGRLLVAGGAVDMPQVNQYSLTADKKGPSMIIDLPNYVWNHSIKYWHENSASKDWRFKKYVNHDLLGSKILGTSWQAPSWRKVLRVADVPWLKDHSMGNDILMPASGYIGMATEALYQKRQAIAHDANVNSSRDFCFRMRNVRFEKALVFDESEDTVIVLSLHQQPGNKDWEEFRVHSQTDEIYMEHCSGLIRLQKRVNKLLTETLGGPLVYPISGQLWYKAQNEVGYGFGPSFQRVQMVESTSGRRTCRSMVSLTEPKSKWFPQSIYSMHPACLDGCFQTVTPSLWAGEISSLDAVVVPSMIDEIVINSNQGSVLEGLSVASSEFSGRGRAKDAKSYFSNCEIYDPANRTLMMKMKGLRFVRLDTGAKPDPHTFDRISWKPDIKFLSQEQMDNLPVDEGKTKTDLVIDLIAHKKPALRVLEINLDASDSSSLWFDGGDGDSRAAYVEYTLVSTDAKSLIKAQTTYEAKRNSSFHVMSPSQAALGIPTSKYDLVVMKPMERPTIDTDNIVDGIKVLLSDQGYALFAPFRGASDQDSGIVEGVETPKTPPSPGSSGLAPGTPASSLSSTSGGEPKSQMASGAEFLESQSLSATEEVEHKNHGWNPNTLGQIATAEGLGYLLRLQEDGEIPGSLYVLKPGAKEKQGTMTLCVTQFTKEAPHALSHLKPLLEAARWHIKEQCDPVNDTAETDIILVLDELANPLLNQMDAQAWESLRKLISLGKPLLWVTKGAQLEVTDPHNALAHGLFRVIHMEDANAKITTLDVRSSTGSATTNSIVRVLNSLRQDGPKTFVEREYAERDGIIHVHRVVPDTLVNNFKSDEREGGDLALKSLHGSKAAVALRAERLGTFQSLTWCETDRDQNTLEEDKVEIEIKAVGVNFKVSRVQLRALSDQC